MKCSENILLQLFALVLGLTLTLTSSADTTGRSVGPETINASDFSVWREGHIEVTKSLSRSLEEKGFNLADVMDDADATIQRVYGLGAPGRSMFDYVITLDLSLIHI